MQNKLFRDNRQRNEGIHVDTRSRRRLSRARVRSGLAYGTLLAEWLNDQTQVRYHPTVLNAIYLLHEMNREKNVRHKALWWETPPEGPPTGPEVGAKLLRILHGLTPSRWAVMPGGAGYAIDVEPRTSLERAFLLLSKVTLEGVLDRLRRCKRDACRKWFMAARPTMVFCSEDCQQEYWFEYRKTPKGLKEQARRMRNWRARQKSQSRKEKR